MGWWLGEEDKSEDTNRQKKCEKCGEATDVLDKWKHIEIHICLDCRREIYLDNIDFVGH
jgi:ribosomal protein S14|tara:strand:+ start:172 stop:348 length:177 start_codon:yes stop_codon:yes gene_type:complete